MNTTQHPEAEWLETILDEHGGVYARGAMNHIIGKVTEAERLRLYREQDLKSKSQITAKLKSAEIEGRIKELKTVHDWLGHTSPYPILDKRLADLEAQLKTIKGEEKTL